MRIIFRLGQLIIPKFAWILYIDMTNLIFKVTLENGAAKFKPKILKNAHYLCSGSKDFTQTCMILKSGHSNKPLKFLHLDLIFKVKLKIAWLRWILTLMHIIFRLGQRILPKFTWI